jgi:predicted RNA-binding Zn-ribbon protein involved in translation (DUF1610 family)
MDYKRQERHIPVCLECGDKIRYGRTDKKFCCDECKTRHYNALARTGRAFRRRVLGVLDRNYSVLEGLMRAGVESVDLMDVMSMGFSPLFCTSCSKSGRHDEYGCFDIKYIMTRTRIYSISKIQNFD